MGLVSTITYGEIAIFIKTFHILLQIPKKGLQVFKFLNVKIILTKGSVKTDLELHDLQPKSLKWRSEQYEKEVQLS